MYLKSIAETQIQTFSYFKQEAYLAILISDLHGHCASHLDQ